MRKYLARLIVYSLLLGVLPSLLIGSVSYMIAVDEIEAKVKDGNMLWLAQTQLRVEQMLRSIERSSTQFINSSIISQSMKSTYDYSDFAKIRALSAELYNLQSSDVVINQASLINLDHQWALNLNTMKPLQEFDKHGELSDLAKKSRGIQWYIRNDFTSGVNSPVPAHTVTLVQKIPSLPQTDTPKGLLVVSASASDIWDVLSSTNTASMNFILDRSGRNIFDDEKNAGHDNQIN